MRTMSEDLAMVDVAVQAAFSVVKHSFSAMPQPQPDPDNTPIYVVSGYPRCYHNFHQLWCAMPTALSSSLLTVTIGHIQEGWKKGRDTQGWTHQSCKGTFRTRLFTGTLANSHLIGRLERRLQEEAGWRVRYDPSHHYQQRKHQ